MASWMNTSDRAYAPFAFEPVGRQDAGANHIPCKRVPVPLVKSPHTMKPTRRCYVPPLFFRVVQPYGRDKAREATMITGPSAFASGRSPRTLRTPSRAH